MPVSLMRGLIQGWPKQFGTVWITRAATLPSKAAPMEAEGGKFGATLSVRDRRVVEARVTLRQTTDQRPSPTFAHGVNLRYFPELTAGKHDQPVQRSPRWSWVRASSPRIAGNTIVRP
jgi:Acetoacetate decarboxylase (ADC)